MDLDLGLDMGLGGKRVLVTGAGQGVGEVIAHTFAAAGAHVAVNDFFADRADRVAKAILADDGDAAPAAFDVTDFDGVHRAIAEIGPIDILVNNAGNAGSEGFGSVARFVDTTPQSWEKYLAVNLRGVMNCVHAALPAMIERGWGRVVTIVSDAARSGGGQMAAYAAAKAGAAGFCRAIAEEVARHGITVNNLSLGTMRTPATEAFWSNPDNAAQHRALMANYLVRRPGEPADVAWMVAMLASPHASWVTGQTIPVNGGYSFAL